MSERQRESFYTFSQQASMHGIRYVTMRERSTQQRIIWSVALFIGLGYSAAGIGLFLNDFSKFLVATKVRVRNAETLTFPTVTICNRNIWKKTKTKDMQYQFPGLAEHLKHIMSDLYMDGKLPPHENKYNWSDPILKFLAEDLQPAESVRFLEEMTSTLNDTFKSCSRNKVPVQCNEIFDRVLTDAGYCFRFNAHGGFTAHNAGASGGVQVVVDAQTDEYYVGPNAHSEGFMVALHDSTDVPLMDEISYGISPGFDTSLIIQRKQIKRVPPPADNGQSDCFDAVKRTNPLHFHSNYSYTACVSECRVSFVIRKCGCRDLFQPPLNGSVSCTIKEMLYCSTPALREFPIKPSNIQACGCKPKCEEVLYSAKQSSNKYPSKGFIEEHQIGLEEADYMKDNVAMLKIVYGELTYEYLEEDILYNGWDLIANIGGTLGVCIGASILTLVEFMEFGVHYLSTALARYKRSKSRVISQSTDANSS